MPRKDICLLSERELALTVLSKLLYLMPTLTSKVLKSWFTIKNLTS